MSDLMSDGKMSRVSISTNLRCDGTFNDQFIYTISAESAGEIFLKSVNNCRSYGPLSRGSFFLNTVYISSVEGT